MKECRKQVQKVSQSVHYDLTLSWKSKKISNNCGIHKFFGIYSIILTIINSVSGVIFHVLLSNHTHFNTIAVAVWDNKLNQPSGVPQHIICH